MFPFANKKIKSLNSSGITHKQPFYLDKTSQSSLFIT